MVSPKRCLLKHLHKRPKSNYPRCEDVSTCFLCKQARQTVWHKLPCWEILESVIVGHLKIPYLCHRTVSNHRKKSTISQFLVKTSKIVTKPSVDPSTWCSKNLELRSITSAHKGSSHVPIYHFHKQFAEKGTIS